MAQVLGGVVAEQPAERLGGLFDAHYERLYALARRLAPSSEEARDLVQDTFLRAARSLASLPVGAEEAWLVRVLVNIRRDQWRRAAVRRRHAAETLSAPDAADPESAIVAHATVWPALDALTPRRRAVVVMHELEGLPIARIASLLGISAITARWHLSKARRELARLLGVPPGGSHDER